MKKSINSLLLTTTIFLTACGTTVETKPVTAPLAEAPLVKFNVGDIVASANHDDSNAISGEVVAVNGDVATFSNINNPDHYWTRHHNFVVPATSWNGSEQSGSGTQEITNITGNIFPLKIGNTMSYANSGASTKHPEGWTDSWRCKVESEENVTTPLGDLDTFKVKCSGKWRDKTWYYSPKLGTPVIYINHHRSNNETRHRVLTSINRAL